MPPLRPSPLGGRESSGGRASPPPGPVPPPLAPPLGTKPQIPSSSSPPLLGASWLTPSGGWTGPSSSSMGASPSGLWRELVPPSSSYSPAPISGWTNPVGVPAASLVVTRAVCGNHRPPPSPPPPSPHPPPSPAPTPLHP